MHEAALMSVLIRVPPRLRNRLVGSVRREGSNLNDLIVGTLATRYAVPFDPSGRRSKATIPSGAVVVRMPAELKKKIQLDALDHYPSNLTERIVTALAEELEVNLNLQVRNRSPFGGGRRRFG